MDKNEIKRFKEFLTNNNCFVTFTSLHRDYSTANDDFVTYCKGVDAKHAITSAFPFRVGKTLFWQEINSKWLDICDNYEVTEDIADNTNIARDADNWFDNLLVIGGRKEKTMVEDEKLTLSFETKKKNVLRFSHDISARMEDNAFYYVSLNIDKEHSDRLVIVLSDTPTKYTYRARTRIKGFWHVENKDVIFYLSQYLNVPVDDLDGKKVEVFGMKYNKDKTKIALRVARKFKEL